MSLIDAWFKRLFRRDASIPIEPLSRDQAKDAADMSGLPEERLVEFSRDYNGRVREAAVRELALFRTEAAFRAIVERLNDWVPQVRRAAQLSLEPFLTAEFAELILCCIQGIVALRARGRADHTPVLDRIAEILRSAEARQVLLSRLSLCDGKEARYLLEVLSAKSEELGEDCVRAFSRHTDCVVRLKVVTLCRAQPQRYRAILEELRCDGHPRVRREALSCLWVLSNDVERIALLEGALLDCAASVREIAIWYARKSGFELEKYAEQALAQVVPDNRAKVSLIGFLTSLKVQDGSGFAHSALQSDCASVRVAALSFIVVMERDVADEFVASALADSSTKVARFARRSILRGQIALSHAQYLKAIRKLLLFGYMGRALTVCALMGIWARLEGLLFCLGESRCEKDQFLVRKELLNWERHQGRSAIRIDAEERARLAPLLSDRRIRDVVSCERPLVFALQTSGLWADG